jgi:hypothetical protein
MTQEPFIQPRFVGPRFEGHTLPLSAAKDLSAYEELVLELAKHLFRQKNQDRVRLPKNFASGFSLHIERIDDGSAKPALVAMMLAGQRSHQFRHRHRRGPGLPGNVSERLLQLLQPHRPLAGGRRIYRVVARFPNQ